VEAVSDSKFAGEKIFSSMVVHELATWQASK
jgi:hypothetical protein